MTFTFTNTLYDISFLLSLPFINLFSDEPDSDLLSDDGASDADSAAFDEVEEEEEFDLDGDLASGAVKKAIGYDFDENEIGNYDNDLYDDEDDLPAGYHVDEGESEY